MQLTQQRVTCQHIETMGLRFWKSVVGVAVLINKIVLQQVTPIAL